jgi:hypothetical protein
VACFLLTADFPQPLLFTTFDAQGRYAKSAARRTIR